MAVPVPVLLRLLARGVVALQKINNVRVALLRFFSRVIPRLKVVVLPAKDHRFVEDGWTRSKRMIQTKEYCRDRHKVVDSERVVATDLALSLLQPHSPAKKIVVASWPRLRFAVLVLIPVVLVAHYSGFPCFSPTATTCSRAF